MALRIYHVLLFFDALDLPLFHSAALSVRWRAFADGIAAARLVQNPSPSSFSLVGAGAKARGCQPRGGKSEAGSEALVGQSRQIPTNLCFLLKPRVKKDTGKESFTV